MLTLALALLVLALVLASSAAAWFARGEREAIRARDEVRDAARAIFGGQERAAEKVEEVHAEAVELAKGDHLGELLDEKMPPR